MKKQNLKKMLNLRSLSFIAILSVAVLAASCNKEDDGYIPEEVVASQDLELKKGKPDNVGPKGAPAPGDVSIAEIAIGANFTELVGALSYVDAKLDAGLIDLFLNGTDQYTVFAPNNEAFKGLYGALGIDGITDLSAELVLDVLLYHVAEGRRAANSVVPPVRDRTISTLLGSSFTVNSDGVITDIAGQTVNIVAADISASNGIIHVIDTVLLPLE